MADPTADPAEARDVRPVAVPPDDGAAQMLTDVAREQAPTLAREAAKVRPGFIGPHAGPPDDEEDEPDPWGTRQEDRRGCDLPFSDDDRERLRQRVAALRRIEHAQPAAKREADALEALLEHDRLACEVIDLVESGHIMRTQHTGSWWWCASADPASPWEPLSEVRPELAAFLAQRTEQ